MLAASLTSHRSHRLANASSSRSERVDQLPTGDFVASSKPLGEKLAVRSNAVAVAKVLFRSKQRLLLEAFPLFGGKTYRHWRGAIERPHSDGKRFLVSAPRVSRHCFA